LASIRAPSVELEAPVRARYMSGQSDAIRSRQIREHVVMHCPGRMLDARLMTVRSQTWHTTGTRSGFWRK